MNRFLRRIRQAYRGKGHLPNGKDYPGLARDHQKLEVAKYMGWSWVEVNDCPEWPYEIILAMMEGESQRRAAEG